MKADFEKLVALRLQSWKTEGAHSAAADRGAALAGGRLCDAGNDGAVRAYGRGYVGELGSLRYRPFQSTTSLHTVRGRPDAPSAAQLL